MTPTLQERLAEVDEPLLTADGFDDAFLGLGRRCGQPTVVIYDRDRCIGILMQRDGMSFEDANEYFDFNVVGAWVGEQTPMFVEALD